VAGVRGVGDREIVAWCESRGESSGAYACTPRITRSGDGFEGHAHIECWRGTPEELLVILSALVTVPESPDVVVEIEWMDGTRSRAKGLTAVGEQLDGVPKTRSINARLSCTGQCDETWVRTQQAIPGLSIKVRGTDHDVVVAATRSAFARAMIGYVDRLGTWRAPALMVLTIGVPATCMLLLPKPDGWWSQVAVIVTLLAWLIISLLVIWPYFLAARPFVLVESVERPKTGSSQLRV